MHFFQNDLKLLRNHSLPTLNCGFAGTYLYYTIYSEQKCKSRKTRAIESVTIIITYSLTNLEEKVTILLCQN